MKRVLAKEIIQRIAQETGVIPYQVKNVLEVYNLIAFKELFEGRTVPLGSLGEFRVDRKKPKTVRNPYTNKDHKIGWRFMPRFHFSPTLKGTIKRSENAELEQD